MTYLLSVLWLLVLVGAPVAIYWIFIRPKAKWTEVAAGVDGFWPRLWARIKAFRTFVSGTIGTYVTILPDLLNVLAGIDYQQVLPAPWSIFAGPAVTISLMLVRATATTPTNAPPSAEA